MYIVILIYIKIVCQNNKSDKHIRNVERYERNLILDNEDEDQVVIPNDFFQENETRRARYVDHFRLTDDMRVKYINRQTRSHPENVCAKVKTTPKYNHEIEQNDINKLVEMICSRFGTLIKTYHFKYQVIVGCEYLKYREDEDDERITIPSANTKVNLTKLQLKNIDPASEIVNNIDKVELVGSGWDLQKITYLDVEFYKQNGVLGNSYVKLPIRSNAYINIKNKDNFCFIWSILARMYPVNEYVDRVSKYDKHFNKIRIGDIDLSKGMFVTDVPKFERLNNNLSINIFELQNNKDEKNSIVPLYISKNNLDKTIVDLLLYKNHYLLIKKLHTLLNNRDHHQNIVCRNCLSTYPSQEKLEQHRITCLDNDAMRYIKHHEKYLKWNKLYEKMPIYLTLYADFECLNKPIENENQEGNTIIISNQVPVNHGIFIVNHLKDITPLRSGYYEPPFGIKNKHDFVKCVQHIESIMSEFFKRDVAPKIWKHKNVQCCWLCDIDFENDYKQIEHYCKLTGKYLGNAHQDCIDIVNKSENIKYIHCLFHNFSGYDSHLFFKELIDIQNELSRVNVVPETKEKYLSVTYGCVKFLDSMQFLNGKLDDHAENLSDDAFVYLKQHFGQHWRLFKEKISYSYEYFKTIEDYEKPIEELQILGKEAYYSKLDNYYPEKTEIDRTNHIINILKIKNGRELTRLYNKADVMLLADIFENFMNMSKKEFKINPLYNISLPGYTWDVGLRYTNINLERIQDVNMFQLFESGIRAGISGVLGDRYLESDDENKIIQRRSNKSLWMGNATMPTIWWIQRR